MSEEYFIIEHCESPVDDKVWLGHGGEWENPCLVRDVCPMCRQCHGAHLEGIARAQFCFWQGLLRQLQASKSFADKLKSLRGEEFACDCCDHNDEENRQYCHGQVLLRYVLSPDGERPLWCPPFYWEPDFD